MYSVVLMMAMTSGGGAAGVRPPPWLLRRLQQLLRRLQRLLRRLRQLRMLRRLQQLLRRLQRLLRRLRQLRLLRRLRQLLWRRRPPPVITSSAAVAASCCGGYSGCCGGYASCCGGYSGCCGGYSSWAGCTGGVIYGDGMPAGAVVVPEGGKVEEPVKKPDGDKKPEEVKPPKDDKKPEANVPAPATIIVSLPADAKLTIDDATTTSTSSVRRVHLAGTARRQGIPLHPEGGVWSATASRSCSTRASPSAPVKRRGSTWKPAWPASPAANDARLGPIRAGSVSDGEKSVAHATGSDRLYSPLPDTTAPNIPDSSWR